jgi:hypothetical protein
MSSLAIVVTPWHIKGGPCYVIGGRKRGTKKEQKREKKGRREERRRLRGIK